METLPKYVVMSGNYGAGKSTISKYLRDELSFVMIDTLSKLQKYGDSIKTHLDEIYNKIWNEIYSEAEDNLKKGKNVVIDTTSYNEKMREKLFSLPAEADKYLLWIQRNEDLALERVKERPEGWSPTGRLDIKYEDPKPNDKYKILVYQNNTAEDLKRMKRELAEKFLDESKK